MNYKYRLLYNCKSCGAEKRIKNNPVSSHFTLCNGCYKKLSPEQKRIGRRQLLGLSTSPELVEKRRNRRRYHNAVAMCKRALSMPKWVDIEQIALFYEQCPDGYHVDHIIPLGAKDVCGLHVIHNLQYLSGTENARKGNRIV